MTNGIGIVELMGDRLLPKHSKHWTDETATKVTELAGMAHADGLEAALRGLLLDWGRNYEYFLSKYMRKRYPAYKSLKILVGIAPLWVGDRVDWHSCTWVSASFMAPSY